MMIAKLFYTAFRRMTNVSKPVYITEKIQYIVKLITIYFFYSNKYLAEMLNYKAN